MPAARPATIAARPRRPSPARPPRTQPARQASRGLSAGSATGWLLTWNQPPPDRERQVTDTADRQHHGGQAERQPRRGMHGHPAQLAADSRQAAQLTRHRFRAVSTPGAHSDSRARSRPATSRSGAKRGRRQDQANPGHARRRGGGQGPHRDPAGTAVARPPARWSNPSGPAWEAKPAARRRPALHGGHCLHPAPGAGRLRAIAPRGLGSLSDGGDAVRETWQRLTRWPPARTLACLLDR
jgi:hypothetical protein